MEKHDVFFKIPPKKIKPKSVADADYRRAIGLFESNTKRKNNFSIPNILWNMKGNSLYNCLLLLLVANQAIVAANAMTCKEERGEHGISNKEKHLKKYYEKCKHTTKSCLDGLTNTNVRIQTERETAQKQFVQDYAKTGNNINHQLVVATNKYLDPQESNRMSFLNDTLCFLKSGANVDAVFNPSPNSSLTLVSTPLGLAVQKEYNQQAKDLIDILLKNGADPKVKFGQEKLTAIHLASKNGNHQALDCLLKPSSVDIKDISGRTPIMYAILNSQLIGVEKIVKTISLLKSKGHDINAVDNNNSTALRSLCVVSHQSPNLALTLGRCLLALGADVNMGESPLFALMMTSKKPLPEDIEELAIELVRKGADLSITDRNNKSILTLAQEAKAGHLVNVIEDQLKNQANLIRNESKRLII